MTQALTIRDLEKTYDNGFQALKGISLEVRQGDFLALLGPNGAGKSTTIGIISSLIKKSSGKVFIFGLDTDTHFAQAKHCIGIVPQEFNFHVFEPVIEILVNQAGYFGIERTKGYEAAENALHQLGLWEKRHQMARNLSGGMKRRLMIARALIHRPKLLILDEPTAGVDIETRRSMWTFLRKINADGITIILTTHYLEEAESLCRDIAIIDGGRLIESTSMQRLLDQLHMETFVLYLRHSLLEPPRLPDYRLQCLDDKTLEVSVSKGQSLNALFGELATQGLEIVSMKNKANRLEETFLRLVEKERKE